MSVENSLSDVRYKPHIEVDELDNVLLTCAHDFEEWNALRIN